jgi:hypothetical protein
LDCPQLLHRKGKMNKEAGSPRRENLRNERTAYRQEGEKEKNFL